MVEKWAARSALVGRLHCVPAQADVHVEAGGEGRMCGVHAQCQRVPAAWKAVAEEESPPSRPPFAPVCVLGPLSACSPCSSPSLPCGCVSSGSRARSSCGCVLHVGFHTSICSVSSGVCQMASSPASPDTCGTECIWRHIFKFCIQEPISGGAGLCQAVWPSPPVRDAGTGGVSRALSGRGAEWEERVASSGTEDELLLEAVQGTLA